VIQSKEFRLHINGIVWDHSKKPVILWDQSVIPAKAFSPDECCGQEVKAYCKASPVAQPVQPRLPP
jgi:hypothetical protein